MYIDISKEIYHGMSHWPSDPPTKLRLFKDLQKGGSSNVSLIETGLHNGTHIDSPKHMDSQAEGIDVAPLEIFHGKVFVKQCRQCDFIQKSDIDKISLKDIQAVFFYTKNSDRNSFSEFTEDFVYLEPDAAEYLISNGIKLVGIDAPSIDQYKRPNHPSHSAILDHGAYILENLYFDEVPEGVYEYFAFPLKVRDGDSGPARVVLKV